MDGFSSPSPALEGCVGSKRWATMSGSNKLHYPDLYLGIQVADLPSRQQVGTATSSYSTALTESMDTPKYRARQIFRRGKTTVRPFSTLDDLDDFDCWKPSRCSYGTFLVRKKSDTRHERDDRAESECECQAPRWVVPLRLVSLADPILMLLLFGGDFTLQKTKEGSAQRAADCNCKSVIENHFRNPCVCSISLNR